MAVMEEIKTRAKVFVGNHFSVQSVLMAAFSPKDNLHFHSSASFKKWRMFGTPSSTPEGDRDTHPVSFL